MNVAITPGVVAASIVAVIGRTFTLIGDWVIVAVEEIGVTAMALPPSSCTVTPIANGVPIGDALA